ncbi:GNAT family N-acetyltransferase [Erysipelothrix sp. HDW6C]|uniref:GNAT family N-acetyltransferase n=1 Tax=Erysipelothrix sp. HDW6C TaxID=2714930 RepID=UPI00140B7942|nr:GNAT family N-acetyltransferase [Erysipelothrix sp. HDW6C]QIK69537.1 GNAT family N-acetyltransferase [Erysipelothrix sp. HDW6C]
MVELKKIDETNYVECLNLKASVADENFVDPVAWSLAEAWVLGKDSCPFAIYADGIMVGYVFMFALKENPQIINFLIDDRFQNMGYGAQAARLCVDFLVKTCDAQRISLPVDPDNIVAQKLWSKVGFSLTKDQESGYHYMRMNTMEAIA